MQDSTDLTTLVGNAEEYKKLVENCFTDKDDGNVTLGDARALTMNAFLDRYGITTNRRTKLQGWVAYYGLGTYFKREEEHQQNEERKADPVAKRQKILDDELPLSLPRIPELSANLVSRAEAKTKVISYLKQCHACDEEEVLDNVGKFTLLGPSGVKGIGKSEILGQICDSWAKEALGDDAKAVYVTYNGMGSARDYCLNPDQIGQNYGAAFGHLLLVSCGVPEETAVQVSLEDAIDFVVNGLGCKDSVLVICVDEIIELDKGKDHKPNEWTLAALTMSRLMKLQDDKKGKVIFVFTGILDSMFTTLQSLSGRAVRPLPLTLIPLNNVFSFNLVPTSLQPFIEQPAVYQLIISCAGHPRATVDGLKRAARYWHKPPNGEAASLIQTAELVGARTTIVKEVCKFDISYVDTEILKEWFNFLDPISYERREDLLAKGILHTIVEGNATKTEFLFPLLLQAWASENQESAFGFHLYGLFNADLVLETDSEKNMEAVMYHYEAVLRKATEGRTFTLWSLYKSDHVAEEYRTRELKSIIVQGSEQLVTYVDNFVEDIQKIIKLLKSGWIVVSKRHSEVGVEYLVPYHSDGQLLVACVQCKFVNQSTNWSGIKKKMLTAVKGLDSNGVNYFPVIYTTADQKTMIKTTYGDGAYFIETDLYNFTKRLGILRMHTMKLGANLFASHPYLRTTS